MELWVDVLANDYHQQGPLTVNELEHWHMLSYRRAADNCIKCESYQHSVKWHNDCFINEKILSSILYNYSTHSFWR